MQQLLAIPDTLRQRRTAWQDIAFQMRSKQMPPRGSPRPPQADTDAVLEVISRAIAQTPQRSEKIKNVEQGPPTHDWLTFSYDPGRLGWDRGETLPTPSSKLYSTSSGFRGQL